MPKPSVPALPSHHARKLNMVPVVLTVRFVLAQLAIKTKLQALGICLK